MISRDFAREDLDWMHDLNEDHAAELSSVSRRVLETLVSQSTMCLCIDPKAAFLLVMDQDADYDSPNFLWFKQKAARFLYVDRIVVSAAHRRKGLARQLYQELIQYAQAHDHTRIFAEVNSNPPNPKSDAFHAALGFEVIGGALLEDRGKSVRYLSLSL